MDQEDQEVSRMHHRRVRSLTSSAIIKRTVHAASIHPSWRALVHKVRKTSLLVPPLICEDCCLGGVVAVAAVVAVVVVVAAAAADRI